MKVFWLIGLAVGAYLLLSEKPLTWQQKYDRLHASYGKRQGQVGYDAKADFNADGRNDLSDLAIFAQSVPAGVTIATR